MWLSDLSVKRPVFAAVIALLLCALGLLAFSDLEVREYPDISAPIISLADPVNAVEEVEFVLERGAKLVLVRPAPVPGVMVV